MNSVELPLVSIMMIDWTNDDGCSRYRRNMVDWAGRLLNGLERRLDGREYVATESFTVADILMSHVLAVVKDDSLLKPYARGCDLSRPLTWAPRLEANNRQILRPG